MKHKLSRHNTQSYNRRPISVAIKQSSLNSSNPYGQANHHQENSTEILLTTPTNCKGFGKNIEKEKLYEQTMQLKTLVNKLTKELTEVKSKNVKLDIELRKKEAIIKTIVEENENDFELVKQENMDKATESSLVSKLKREYLELKKKHYKLLEQNESLNTNIKITKINEIKIETQILQNELNKVTELYYHSQNQNIANEKNVKELLEFKDKFIVQHAIIDDLQKKNDSQNKEIESMRKKVMSFNDQKSEMEIKDKKLKIENAALQKQIEKLSNDKKNSEKGIMHHSDYEKKIRELQEKCEHYKKLSPKTNNNNALYNQSPVMPSSNQKGQNMHLKEFAYDSVKTIERIPDSEYEEKNKLLQGIIKDCKVKINVYETYIRSIHQDPELVLKNGNYNSGVINSKSNIDGNIQKTASSLRESSNINDLNSKITNGNQNGYIEPNHIISNSNNGDTYDIESYFQILQKALETANVTQEALRDDLNAIYQNFENKTETTKEEFLLPFVEMFAKHYKLHLQSDINSLNAFFGELIENLDNDTEQFYEKITEMFNRVVDYSKAANLDDQLEKLIKQLQPSKDFLITSFKKADPSNTGVITFQDMWKILNENIMEMSDDQLELMLYLMKKNTPSKQSLFNLNYTIIFEMLKIDNNSNSNANTNKNLCNGNGNANDNSKDSNEEEDYEKEFEKNIDEAGLRDEDDNANKERDRTNNQTLKRIFTVMVYSSTSFDNLFGKYISEVTDDKTARTARSIKIKDFEKVLIENEIQISKNDLKSFEAVYGLENEKELNVLKIKEALKKITIDSLKDSKGNHQLEKIVEEDS